jgi:hypothetical protein
MGRVQNSAPTRRSSGQITDRGVERGGCQEPYSTFLKIVNFNLFYMLWHQRLIFPRRPRFDTKIKGSMSQRYSGGHILEKHLVKGLIVEPMKHGQSFSVSLRLRGVHQIGTS